jgi:hypothetical protein
MKKKSLSPKTIQRLKNVGWLLAYLVIFDAIPYIKVKSFISSMHCVNSGAEKQHILIYTSIFLVSMIALILPYKLSKFFSLREKILYVIIGLLIPLYFTIGSFFASVIVCPQLSF